MKKKIDFFGTHSIFEGLYKNNKPNGYGKLKSIKGLYYEGNFKQGKLHGKGTFYNINLNFNKNHTVIKKNKVFGNTLGSRDYTKKNVIIIGNFKSNLIDDNAFVLDSSFFFDLKFKNGYLNGKSLTINPSDVLENTIFINIYKNAISDSYSSLKKTEELNLYPKNRAKLFKMKKDYKKIITKFISDYNWYPNLKYKSKKDYLKILDKWAS